MIEKRREYCLIHRPGDLIENCRVKYGKHEDTSTHQSIYVVNVEYADQLEQKVAKTEKRIEKLREAFATHLGTMRAINEHTGYQFSQPLINAWVALKEDEESK